VFIQLLMKIINHDIIHHMLWDNAILIIAISSSQYFKTIQEHCNVLATNITKSFTSFPSYFLGEKKRKGFSSLSANLTQCISSFFIEENRHAEIEQDGELIHLQCYKYNRRPSCHRLSASRHKSAFAKSN
jgi:hypothetical protein